jgi:hypothetical protein
VRRRFLKALATAPLAPSALFAAPQAAPPAPTPAPPTPEKPPGPVAQALGQVVRQRYGSQLEASDLAEIDKGIEANLQAADRLKGALTLGNADEPVTYFEARLRKAAPRPAPRRPAAPKAPRRG